MESGGSSFKIIMGVNFSKWSALKGMMKCFILSTIPTITIWSWAYVESSKVSKVISSFTI